MRTRLRHFQVPLPLAVPFLIALGSMGTPSAKAADWRFAVRFDRAAHAAAYTGRVYIFFSRMRPSRGADLNWFFPEEFIAEDVTRWQPGETLLFRADDRKVLAYPAPLATLDLAARRAGRRPVQSL